MSLCVGDCLVCLTGIEKGKDLRREINKYIEKVRKVGY
jgi:hypothetical protein